MMIKHSTQYTDYTANLPTHISLFPFSLSFFPFLSSLAHSALKHANEQAKAFLKGGQVLQFCKNALTVIHKAIASGFTLPVRKQTFFL